MRFFFLLVSTCLLVWSCKPNKNDSESTAESLGKVDSRLEEASGLVLSAANPGMLWTINDSGNPPEVFLIDQHAKTKMVCKLLGARNRDWEDIAIGAGPDPQKKYIYVGDIGDNWGQYEYKIIYRFEEPKLNAQDHKTITQFDTLVFKMPDGGRDAETLLIDPFDNDLFIISKSEDSVGLYTAPYPFRRDTVLLKRVLKMPFTEIVAGSISQDGLEVLLKDYKKVYYWKRSEDENLVETFTRKPLELPYEREQQGEAISWSDKQDEFYTLSEGYMGTSADLLVYKIKK